MLTNRAFRRRQRGASLVELALVLFILLLILAGIVDFGRVFNHYVVITNASREGARTASLRPHQRDRIEAAAKREMEQSSVDPDGLVIEIEPNPDDYDYPEGFDRDHEVYGYGRPITVTVGYDVPTIIADIAGPGFGTLPLWARTTMAIQGPEPPPGEQTDDG